MSRDNFWSLSHSFSELSALKNLSFLSNGKCRVAGGGGGGGGRGGGNETKMP